MVNCPQCGAEISEEARSCPKCGAPQSIPLKAKLKKYGSWAFWVIVSLIVIGRIANDNENGRIANEKPACELSSLRAGGKMLVTNGEADFGIEGRGTVKNLGGRGDFKVQGRLATSEGTFQRVQRLLFDKEETRELVFDFPEPTLNVDMSSVQFVVECSRE